MKEYRLPSGERKVWYEPAEIDQIMTDELHRARLLPEVADGDVSIDIEAFVERHLRLQLDQYAELPSDVLGVTEFVPGKDPRVSINGDLTGSALDDEDTTPGLVGRWRATVAHEAGHVLLHRSLFELDSMQRGLFSGSAQEPGRNPRLLRCLKRDVTYRNGGPSDWKEVQANMAIGGLLMPKPLIVGVVREERARLGLCDTSLTANGGALEDLIAAVAERFTVSRQAARIRIEGLTTVAPRGQATL